MNDFWTFVPIKRIVLQWLMTTNKTKVTFMVEGEVFKENKSFVVVYANETMEFISLRLRQ